MRKELMDMNSGQADDSAIQQELMTIIERIAKLSNRPENPGMAYRNLETIQALSASLKDKLNGQQLH